MMTVEKCRELYSYWDGVLYWKKPPRASIKKGDHVGTLDKYGYLVTSFAGKQYLVHRLIWLWHYGEWPKHEIDHINGIKTDNHLYNMRDVKHQENLKNSEMRRKRPVRVRRIDHRLWDEGTWVVYLYDKRVGTYRSKKEAIKAAELVRDTQVHSIPRPPVDVKG